MIDKVVYFSGIHGSGKSTLIKDISLKGPFIVYDNISLKDKLYDTYHRGVLRMAKYWIDTQRMIELSEKNPDKVILGSRCIYDNIAYLNGFVNINWIKASEHAHHTKIFEAMFYSSCLPKKIVYVNPPEEWAIEMIKKRWETQPKKWREDEFEYLSAVDKAFSRFYSNENGARVLKLTETDREKRVNIVLDWMKSIRLIQD